MKNEVNDIRMKLEHQTLPFLFYTNSIDFLMGIQCKGRNVIYEYFKETYALAKVDMPYNPDDFRILFNKKYNDVYITCIQMPEAENFFNCKRIYLTFTKDLSDMLYITIEKDKDNDNLMAGWEDDGQRFELGKINKEEEFEKIVFLYDEVENEKEDNF